MVIVFALLALAVLVTANWYLWRRLFRDTTGGPGRVRRVGAVLIGGGWVLAVGALVAERTGAPFWLQRVLAWPGFLWLALSIYLLLAVVAGEVAADPAATSPRAPGQARWARRGRRTAPGAGTGGSTCREAAGGRESAPGT